MIHAKFTISKPMAAPGIRALDSTPKKKTMVVELKAVVPQRLPAMLQQDARKQCILEVLNLEDTQEEHCAFAIERSRGVFICIRASS
jgi:hypothetical protein